MTSLFDFFFYHCRRAAITGTDKVIEIFQWVKWAIL